MIATLLSETQGSSGPGISGVSIVNRIVQNSLVFIPTHSGVRLGLDGQLSTINAFGGINPIAGEWLITGSAAAFFVKRTIVSGTLEVDAGAGFLQLNADRTYENIKASAGTKTTEVFFEFSSDASGTPVVASATLILISQQGIGFI